MKLLGLIFVIIVFICGSELNAQYESDPGITYRQQAPATGYMMDVNFVKQAASGSMLEVGLSKLAVQKSTSESVKQFGIMMQRDQIKAHQELKNIASNNNISVAGVMPREKIDDFSALNGSEFDKAYITAMVEDHKDNIIVFENASSTVKNIELKRWIDKTLPVLKNHLQLAQKTQNELNK